MSNVLFMGNYFPELSIRSLSNYQHIRLLKQNGHNVTLLSKSWCTASGEEFVDYDPRQLAHIHKMYFVDPLQAQYSNEDIGLMGLASKICRFSNIDFVIVADIEYGMVAELIKLYFNIPVFFEFFSDAAPLQIIETYTKNWLDCAFDERSTIVCHKPYIGLFQKFRDRVKIIGTHPYSYAVGTETIDVPTLTVLHVVGQLRSYGNRPFLITQLKSLSQDFRLKLMLWGPGKEEVAQALSDDASIDILPCDRLTDLLSLFADQPLVLSPDAILFADRLSMDWALLMHSLGTIPILNDASRDSFPDLYQPKWKTVCTGLSALVELTVLEEDQRSLKNALEVRNG